MTFVFLQFDVDDLGKFGIDIGNIMIYHVKEPYVFEKQYDIGKLAGTIIEILLTSKEPLTFLYDEVTFEINDPFYLKDLRKQTFKSLTVYPIIENEQIVGFALIYSNKVKPVYELTNNKLLNLKRKLEKDFVNVRLRIDGVLQSVRKLEKHVFDSLVSRVKVMSALNVMENRLCQDGRMSVQVQDKKLDFRVSVVPSVCGQNIVLRLFDNGDEELTLEELGFSKENLKKLNSALNNPYGMILATGPTGSGKTTTLHALIKKMDKEHLKIVTIEDPVEKTIDGIEQIQVNDEINLTFENILRHVLRHDPDVIMVGEIRDKETAELAVRSALTGHLILSTIHTNDSVGAVSRLRNLGIEPYLISGTLRTVLAQRLVRKTCKECRGKGCGPCSFTGFSGRTAISEIFDVDEKISSMIESQSSDAEIRNYIKTLGFKTLKEDAALKIKSGISTKDEIMREGLL